MRIETKFNVGDPVYFLDITKIKLIKGTVVSLSFAIDVTGSETTYRISTTPYCTASSELIDELKSWLGGTNENMYFEVGDHLIFSSEEDFLKSVSTEEIVLAPPAKPKVITIKSDGDTEKHSEQHKGDEQVVQCRQQNY